MRIILSPAKQMVEEEVLPPAGRPVFLAEAGQILAWMQGLTCAEAQKLWRCSDKLARENYRRLAGLTLERNLSPAVLAYDGIAYRYMAPSVFEYGQFDYVQEHLRILSGLYGVLKPMDGVACYRLEMQAKAAVAGHRDLYGFWGDKLYREVMDDSRVVINLASKEYSRCIERYLQPGDRCVTCVFAQQEQGRLVQKGVYAKMARGSMVRYMAVHNVTAPEQLQGFTDFGCRYDPTQSTPDRYVFLLPNAHSLARK